MVVFGLLAIGGCRPTSTDLGISGTVLFDGTPLETGSIAFEGSDGNAREVPIQNGRYTIQMGVGEKTVRIKAIRISNYIETESGKDPIYEQYLPEVYNSKTNLKYTAQRSQKNVDFDLKSDGH